MADAQIMEFPEVKKTFFIADTHFGDEEIIKYENRPFKNAEEMNEVMVERWNSVVGKDDEVYVLGDFLIKNTYGVDDFNVLIRKLNGHKYLVLGNHDIFVVDKRCKGRLYFEEIYDKPVVFNDFIILSHEPMYINEYTPYINIFGHVHNNPMYKTYSKHHFCVSAERIDYTPIEFPRMINLMFHGVDILSELM